MNHYLTKLHPLPKVYGVCSEGARKNYCGNRKTIKNLLHCIFVTRDYARTKYYPITHDLPIGQLGVEDQEVNA